ncbi:MAG: hypothetical protein ACYC2K_15585 [Gemmatimonadales bacterium]
MRKALLGLWVASAVASAGCATRADEGDSMIRIENASSLAFDAVTFAGVSVGPIEAGGRTDYRPVEDVYPYESVEVRAGTSVYTLTLIDRMDPPLPNGRYTYVLDLVEGSGPDGLSLTVAVRED